MSTNDAKKDKQKSCNYKFYLFNPNDFSKYKKITIPSLELDKALNGLYPNISNKDQTPHRNVVLLTASTDSNLELTQKIISIYKSIHPDSKLDEQGYTYTTIVEAGTNADDLDFMRLSSGNNDEKKVKLIPIIYSSDFDFAQQECLRDKFNLIDPRRLLMNIFPKDMTYENSKNNELYLMIYGILFNKYDASKRYVNPTYIHIDEKFDLQSIYNILKSNVITKNTYVEDSSLYIDLIAKIFLYNRIRFIYNQRGYDYSIESTIIGQKSLLSYNISSISELLHLNVKTEESTDASISEVESSDEIYEVLSEEPTNEVDTKGLFSKIQKTVIDEYNETYGTNIKFEDVEFMPGEYHQITSETRKRYLNHIANIHNK